MSTPFYKHTVAYAVSHFGNRQVAILQNEKIKASVEKYLSSNNAQKRGDWFIIKSDEKWANTNNFIKGHAIGGVILDLPVVPYGSPIIFHEFVVPYTIDKFTKRRIATFDDAQEKAEFQDFLTGTQSATGNGDWFVLNDSEGVDIASSFARDHNATIFDAPVRTWIDS